MRNPIPRLTVAGLVFAAGLVTSLPAAARQSAALDLGGYTYIDSRESGGPVFSYVDISGSATAAALDLGDDDVAGGIPLGFTFNYYGTDYTAIAIASNGNLAFGIATNDYNWDDLPIPQPAGTDGWQNPPFLAPWFDDLCPGCDDVGAIYYETRGAAPNRHFVVQYRVPVWGGEPDDRLDFQVILFEGSNEILFQYRDTTVGAPGVDNGASATVGIQGTDIAGLNYSAGEAVIDDGLAIRFLPPTGPFLGLSDPADRRAVSGEAVTYRFALANGTGADADFTVSLAGNVWAASAFPDRVTVAAGATEGFDVTVTVPAKAELAALADSLTVTVSGNGYSASQSVTTRTSPIEQLTDGDDDSDAPSLAADGGKVAFVSAADLTGANADGSREIFVMNTDGTGLRQLTASAGDSGAPSLSADGGKVAFVSAADLTGANADGSREIFVMNTDGTGLRQLTASAGDSGAPSLAADGGKVAFVSDADLLGDGSNADGSREIFAMNADGTGLRQLTASTGDSEYPSLAADGGKVAFVSYADLTGANADGSREIFVINADGTGLRQLTASAGDSGEPRLAADGGKVAFFSRADLLGDGSNADGSREVFVINTDGTGLRQLTFSSETDWWLWSQQLSLSADGGMVAFSSNIDLLGDGSNPDGGFQIFVMSTDGTGLIQVTTGGFVTEGVVGSYAPSLPANGKVAFAANVDPFGDNPDDIVDSQIYFTDLVAMRALMAGIVAAPATGLVTHETGTSVTFAVTLAARPTAEVVLSLGSDDPTEGSVSPVTLHFTPGDWDTPQTVTVTGVDDTEVDGHVAYTVSMSAASTDAAFDGRTASVALTNLDDDRDLGPRAVAGPSSSAAVVAPSVGCRCWAPPCWSCVGGG